MSERERPWSFPVLADEIPETGRHFDIEADEHARAAIAALAGVEGVADLRASFDVTRSGRAGLSVTGTVAGHVDQICVVSLEPMQSVVEESIDLRFAPRGNAEVAEQKRVEVLPDEEGPEPLVDGAIDLGVLATEFLILAIDPYPRKPGVVFEAPSPADPAAHPFAALAVLKHGTDDAGE